MPYIVMLSLEHGGGGGGRVELIPPFFVPKYEKIIVPRHALRFLQGLLTSPLLTNGPHVALFHPPTKSRICLVDKS